MRAMPSLTWLQVAGVALLGLQFFEVNASIVHCTAH